MIILKIIGIILLLLLAILCLFLLILLIVLLLPIKYEIQGEKSTRFYLDVQMYWPLKMFFFRFKITDKSKRIFFRVFNKVLYKDKDEHEENIKEQDVPTENASIDISKSESNTDANEKVDKKESESIEEKGDSEIDVVEEKSEESQIEKITEEEKNVLKNSTNKLNKEKRKKVDEEIEDLVVKETDKLGEEAVEEVENENVLAKIKRLWNYPDRSAIVKAVVKFTKRVFRAILPKNMKLDVEVGFDDPAFTGLVLAWSSILLMCFGNNIKVRGNFQEKILNGYFFAYGKFNLWQLTYAFFALIFTKPIWKIVWNYLRKKKTK